MKFTNFDGTDRTENEQKIIEQYQELKHNICYALDNNLNKDLIKSYFEQFETELKTRGCIDEE